MSVLDVVTCEIKHWNDFEIISVSYFTFKILSDVLQNLNGQSFHLVLAKNPY